MTDVETTIEYYKDLLLYQYINAPNARAVTGLLCSQAIADLIPIALNDAFDIDTALGLQLDILGEYIGFNRVINTTLPRDYFTFEDYIAPLGTLFGFTDYTDLLLNAEVTFYAYIDNGTTTAALNDAEYRILLKLKLLTNVSNNSLYDVNSILYSFFGTDIIIFDQLDMTIVYFIKSDIARIIGIAYDQNLLPKPMGVLIVGVFIVPDPAKLWGFTSYTATSGYTVSFSDYVTGFADATILSYTDGI
jgi:hypothetical protein